MEVLCHHIYEYRKGLRHLVLHTMKSCDREAAERKLCKYDIDFVVSELPNGNFNIFFGKRECVDVIRAFGGIPLNELSSEQDFILGIMLGYDRLAQCERFLKRNSEQKPSTIAKDSKVGNSCRSEYYSKVGIA